MVTSVLKSQYGTSTENDTPLGHKRKTYKGIGGENKTKKKTNAKKKIVEDIDKDCVVEQSKGNQK